MYDKNSYNYFININHIIINNNNIYDKSICVCAQKKEWIKKLLKLLK